MPRASTVRLMVLFTAVSIATSLAGSFLRIALFSFGREWIPSGTLVILFFTGLAAGWLQSRILARHRTAPRGWMIATALGGLAAGFLGNLAAREALSVVGPAAQGRIALWLSTLSWSVTGAACLGTAQALVLWGRRWTSDTLLWLAGLLAVRLGAGALPHLFREAADLGTSFSFLSFIVLPLLSAALVGAGTAWLLDRIVFKVPAGQPFEAGGRTVE